jgi:hypothetical protein
MNRRDLLGILAGASCTGAVSASAADDHEAVGGQDRGPAARFHLHLCAFHIGKKDPRLIVEAHHYCAPVREAVHQCVIFDTTGPGARILGVEYIVSDALYRELPEGERAFWHPHRYEIESGLLVAPGMEPAAEDGLLAGLVTSWGKTWHTWPDPSTSLPTGEAVLMWSATEDGQIPAEAIADRDKRLGISTPEIRKRRSRLGRAAGGGR